MTSSRLGLTLILLGLGASWGMTQPFVKLAVSGGYRHFGLLFWQGVIAAAVLGAILALRRRPLPLTPRQLLFYLAVALLGAVVPGIASFEAARHLPSGVMSLSISAVPMFAFPMALLLGMDRFSALRLAGLGFGLAGVWVLAGPGGAEAGGGAGDGAGAGVSAAVLAAWLPVALIAPAFYGAEANFVGKWGTGGAGPVQLLCGASVVTALICLPLALATGTFIDPRPPWGIPDAALVGSSAINALVYAGYVWLVGRAGAVFAGQVAYLVTGFGVLWAMILLGERYGAGFWIGMALMFAGLFLVQPRDNLPPRDAPGPAEPGAT